MTATVTPSSRHECFATRTYLGGALLLAVPVMLELARRRLLPKALLVGADVERVHVVVLRSTVYYSGSAGVAMSLL